MSSQVHGRNLLSIDYDRNIRTEKIYDDHRKFTLRIIYDQVGRPFLWLPSSGLAAVNVSYFFNGRLAGLQRGAMSERTDIDKQGRIVSRMFADGKVWSYSYLDKVGARPFQASPARCSPPDVLTSFLWLPGGSPRAATPRPPPTLGGRQILKENVTHRSALVPLKEKKCWALRNSRRVDCLIFIPCPPPPPQKK